MLDYARHRTPGSNGIAHSFCRTRRCMGSPNGAERVSRAYVDKGYRGHNTEHPRRVFISGQKRGEFGSINRELRRRSAIEAAIGHMRTDGHLGRCYLKGPAGDAANVILSAVGHNLRLVLAWLRILLRLILIALGRLFTIPTALNPPS
jgi:transposase, IS5 family